jgi:hypothetical protein
MGNTIVPNIPQATLLFCMRLRKPLFLLAAQFLISTPAFCRDPLSLTMLVIRDGMISRWVDVPFFLGFLSTHHA